MGIEQVLSAPAAPWQRAYVERVIGTIRRECLDHVIVLNHHSLFRHLRRFLEYYHRSRCHLSLLNDAPDTRPIQPPEQGRVVSVPQSAAFTIGTNDALLNDRIISASAALAI
jgi:transposase InsO family protein